MTLPNRNDVLTFDWGWRGSPLTEVLSRGTDIDPEFGWRGIPLQPAASATPTIGLRSTARVGVRGQLTMSGGGISKNVTAKGHVGVRARTSTVRFYTTWNPSDTYGLATVTPTQFFSGGSTAAARTRDGQSTGKYYIEFEDHGFYGSGNSGYGFATAAQDLSTWASSSATNGFGIFLSNDVRVNGTTIRSPYGSILGGKRLGFAVDLDSKLFWIRDANGGSWQGVVSGAADPATGVNGFDFSAITSAIHPVVSSGFYAPSLDAFFGDEPQKAAAPAGFKPGWPRNDASKFVLARGRLGVRAEATFAVLEGRVLTGNGRLGVRSRSTAAAFYSSAVLIGRGRLALRSQSEAGVTSFSAALDASGRLGVRSTADLTLLAPLDQRRPVVVAVNS